ncbi:MAG: cation-translocating P-type ATPase [Desulfobulbaceae bacterium]|nr:MAG: cation-translocating P-type ATPase [Desulfobulbaceae bacterium]
MSGDPPATAQYLSLPADAVLAKLETRNTGLSDGEAADRLKAYGPNELLNSQRSSICKLLAEQLKNSLILILLAATLVSAFAGHAVEATAIVIIVSFAVLFGFIQDYRAERAIDSLRRMAAPLATVIRNGSAATLPARDLVPGDILLLLAGNQIPGDARLLEAIHLQTQEASLTGESEPVEKHCNPLPGADLPTADWKNMVFAGTSVSRGRGRAIVVATGIHTEFGKIARMLQTVESGRTPLQISLDKLGRTLTNSALVIIAGIVALGLLRNQPFLEILVFGIALAVAVVPEALPAVVTISLAIGVQRLVRKNSLMRRLAAVETLGSTSVICSDKTGTLTRDEMTVRALLVAGKEVGITGTGYRPAGCFTIDDKAIDLCRPDDNPAIPLILQLLQAGTLVSDAALEESGGEWQVRGDPTEGAIVVAAAKAGLAREDLTDRFPRIGEIPFSPESKRMTSLHRTAKGLVAYTKGAPEVILPSCTRLSMPEGEMELDDAERRRISGKAQVMAAKAMRVLAVAMRRQASREIVEDGLVFLGLVGMIDPPRPEARAAVETAAAAGIRVIMVTGDHPQTARAIAGELGIADSDNIVTGRQLAAMDDNDLATVIDSTGIFARVEPEHKLRIVSALQGKGHVVAMTGDGVNDAPALKKADIGVAMGITGTDVAKDAAAMTLLDDNFSSIVAAVAEGRGIFANIKKYLAFVLSCNIGEIGLMAFVALLGMPLPLTSVQILYVNLATDGLIALALAVDPYEPDLMQLQPRNPRSGILSRPVLNLMLVGGAWSTAVNLAIFTWMLQSGRSVAEAMTVTFVSLVLIQFFKAFNFRSYRLSVLFRPFANRWLNLAVLWEMVLLLLVVYLPFLQRPFGTVALSASDWLVIVAASLTVVPVLELVKWQIRRGKLGELV